MYTLLNELVIENNKTEVPLTTGTWGGKTKPDIAAILPPEVYT